ncbi:hypothetical protein Bca4012_036986 [Brassica carinata]|uniref:Uncharacterized protein n=1 Tax=Brassica carinata TaxID=52824 RepID=A0A8X7WEW7_BRACI|nr:hypothetical protein Bca52824_010678 [Brassica carinata]
MPNDDSPYPGAGPYFFFPPDIKTTGHYKEEVAQVNRSREPLSIDVASASTSQYDSREAMWSNAEPFTIHYNDDPTTFALPLSDGSEESQLKIIAELQVENDVIGQELPKQLQAADKNFLANFAHLMGKNLSIMQFTN